MVTDPLPSGSGDAEAYERPVRVVLSCTKEYCNETDVESLHCEEDIQGRDLLTYRCPQCHAIHQSYRLG